MTKNERALQILNSVSAQFSTEERALGLESFLTEHGFEFIGSGCYKRVFASPKFSFVVKIPRINNGVGTQELHNAYNAPDDIVPFLAPIWQGIGFQLQHKYDLSMCKYPEQCSRLLMHVSDVYNAYNDGAGINHTHDNEGNPIIYDYGQSEQWAKKDEQSC